MQLAIWILLTLAQAPQASPPVTLLTNAELLRAIKGAPEEEPGQPGLYSISLSPISQYPVIGIRRTVAGRSEVHAKFTDVWYVLEGTATLITGGSVVQGVERQPGEVRGRSIRGGNARSIHPGEFAVVAPGVPHWISKVNGKELLYLVVKVPSAKSR